MHNKFLVLANMVKDGDCISPQAVLTGSFNMTNNATRSLENVVLIRDEKIAEAYFREFTDIYGISEDLNWSQPYVDPNYGNAGYGPRVGT